MQILIDIPDDQIKKSLEESKYIHEDEGEKGSVHITMLYTNAQLEFVAVERKTDFYSCEYKILPTGHGRLIDADTTIKSICGNNCGCNLEECGRDFPCYPVQRINSAPTIIEAESGDK